MRSTPEPAIGSEIELSASVTLEELTPGARVSGVLPDRAVTVVATEWHGTQALTLTYRDDGGRSEHEILYRDAESRLVIEDEARAWTFDADGKLIFTGLVPSSPGDGSVSFFGIIFPDARIASVRIKTGESRPGRDDDDKDIVMMDDFIYGEPQPLP